MLGRPSLALALLGLGAVHGLPTQHQDEKRAPQFGFGPPASSFGPGDVAAPNGPCLPIPSADAGKFCLLPIDSPLPDAAGGDSFIILPRDDDAAAADKAKRGNVDEYKRRIADLERRLVILQNRPDKSRWDWDEIWDLRHELEELIGLVKIVAPPGVITTFTPGKRDAGEPQDLRFSPAADDCPSLSVAQRYLDLLLTSLDRDRVPRKAEGPLWQAFEQALDRCGFAIGEFDDGRDYYYEVYRKGGDRHDGPRLWPRGADDAKFDTAGLEAARDALLGALQGATPSLGTWTVLRQMETELQAQAGPGPVSKRQTSSGPGGVIAIGQGACQFADLLALKAALAALAAAYGNDKSRLPPSIFLIEQVIVSVLRLCKEDVPAGWTTFTPGTTQPGGPLVPERPAPGGPLTPDRPGSGGGAVIPDRPGGGGIVIPDRPGGGGTITPDRPGEGGRINPERPDGGRIDGGRIDGGRIDGGRIDGGRINP